MCRLLIFFEITKEGSKKIKSLLCGPLELSYPVNRGMFYSDRRERVVKALRLQGEGEKSNDARLCSSIVSLASFVPLRDMTF